MNTDQPASPEPAAAPVQFDIEAWQAEEAERRAAFAEEVVGLKAGLFDTLEAHGIMLVTVSFDGCGDSGQIEALTAFDEHGEVALPEDPPPTVEPGTDGAADGKPAQKLTDVIELLAYDLLESRHDGWEINEGAFGEFRFDVADRTILLGCHMRIETSEFFETSW